MADEGLSGGFADGTYRPAATTTRQAAVAFLWRLAGEPAGMTTRISIVADGGDVNNSSETASLRNDGFEVAFVSRAAGTIHSCGLLASDGTAECWGFDNGGVVSGTPEGSFTGLSSSGAVACANTVDGELTCWGSNADGMQNVPPVSMGVVAVGVRHVCGIELVTGAVRCWGWNAHGNAEDQVLEVVRTQTFSMTVTGEAQSSTISGTVVDPDGQPVDDVTVLAFGRSGGFHPAAATTTDPDGSYELDAVAPGWYGVVFLSPASSDFATTWYGGTMHRNLGDEVVVAGGGAPVEQIDVTLLAATSLVGTVTDDHGTPVPRHRRGLRAGHPLVARRDDNHRRGRHPPSRRHRSRPLPRVLRTAVGKRVAPAVAPGGADPQRGCPGGGRAR